MPILHALLGGEGEFKGVFERRVNEIVLLSALENPRLKILVDEQRQRADDAYALSFVFAGESITSYIIEQTTFVDFVVQALVLVGNVSKDPMRQRIVTSYPVQVRYQEAYPDGRFPSLVEQKSVIGSMLMGKLGKADLVVEWHKRLLQVRLRERDVWISVDPLLILPEAQQRGGLSKDQADRVAFKVSSAIEGNLSRAADIPIVPSTGGDGAALADLTLSFSDRSDIAFSKPNPSYAFRVSVYGLGSSTAEEAMGRQKKFAVAYGGGFLIEYFSIDPDRKRNLEFDMRLQSIQSVTYIGASRDAQRASSGDMFARLISGFAEDMSINIIPANAKWLERHRATSEPRTAAELTRLVAAKLPAPFAPN